MKKIEIIENSIVILYCIIFALSSVPVFKIANYFNNGMIIFGWIIIGIFGGFPVLMVTVEDLAQSVHKYFEKNKNHN